MRSVFVLVALSILCFSFSSSVFYHFSIFPYLRFHFFSPFNVSVFLYRRFLFQGIFVPPSSLFFLLTSSRVETQDENDRMDIVPCFPSYFPYLRTLRMLVAIYGIIRAKFLATSDEKCTANY